jgi:hypothetical protein
MDATFEITSWDEHPIVEWDDGKVTKAAITKTYAGDIEGDAVLEYVLAYRSDGTAAFVGLERITGTADGRAGSLVLRQVGEFADGAANATLTVVGGSGDFADAAGDGDLVADPSGRVTLILVAAT